MRDFSSCLGSFGLQQFIHFANVLQRPYSWYYLLFWCYTFNLPISDLKLVSFDVNLILSKSNYFPSVSYHNITPVSGGIDRQFICSMNWCLTTIMTTQSSGNFCSTEHSDCLSFTLFLGSPWDYAKVDCLEHFAQRLVWGCVTNKCDRIKMLSLQPNLNICCSNQVWWRKGSDPSVYFQLHSSVTWQFSTPASLDWAV